MDSIERVSNDLTPLSRVVGNPDITIPRPHKFRVARDMGIIKSRLSGLFGAIQFKIHLNFGDDALNRKFRSD
jgi:hypothetical protein